jgi:transposase
MVKKYNEEFRHDALKLASEIGVREASEELNISAKTLYRWQRLDRLDHGIAIKGLRPGGSPEEGMKRLEKENVELRETNLILKKALGFYGGPITGVKPRQRYVWIARHHGASSIAVRCLALHVRGEGYYIPGKKRMPALPDMKPRYRP